MATDLDHLLVPGFTTSRTYQSSARFVPPALPLRNRALHGRRLLQQVDRLVRRETLLRRERRNEGLPSDAGSLITLKTVHGTLDPGDVEWTRDGIQVMAVTPKDGFDYITLFIPRGRLPAFRTRIEAYLAEQTKTGKPKNAALINAIDALSIADFEHMWTDDPDALPDEDEERLFQLWLRVPDDRASATDQRFRRAAQSLQIDVLPGYVRFPDRIVVAARTTRRTLERAIKLLDLIAEIRETRPTARFFIEDLRADDRAGFVNDLVERLEPPQRGLDDVYITILDTGVNRHPLLNPLLSMADRHTVHEPWTVNDREGHGTEMAGIACYGDLAEALSSFDQVPVTAFLESVKIHNRYEPFPRHLYGWVTERATDLVEDVDTTRRRTFSLAVTEVGRTMGLPSEWSATIDRLAFGLPTAAKAEDLGDDDLGPERQRLFVISAGNIEPDDWKHYPTINTVEGIENPGQSWNALTVGAATLLIEYDVEASPGLRRLAGEGELSPSSRTSRTWEKQWPLKPDVVCEGGNGCVEIGHDEDGYVGPGELRLLTTSKSFLDQPLTETGDTSAATSGVSRLAAWVAKRYPSYWPETVRALVVHGASWTGRMDALRAAQPGTEGKYTLLRLYGFGMIDAERTLQSASERATMVLQRTIVPFVRTDGRVVLGDMHMHALPWPREVLEALGEVEVKMHLTLSYFIEPNPSQRGWRSKFRYQSHGLRFAVRGSTETESQFAARVNVADREEDETGLNDPDRENWVIGSQVRNRGSIHRDIWEGTAAKLASKSHVAVFPVGGWWKETGRHSVEVRYSLIVSIEIAEPIDVDVDLYAPIEVTIAADVAVPGT